MKLKFTLKNKTTRCDGQVLEINTEVNQFGMVEVQRSGHYTSELIPVNMKIGDLCRTFDIRAGRACKLSDLLLSL